MFGLENLFGFCKNPEMNKVEEKKELIGKMQIENVIKDMKVEDKMKNEKVEEIKNEELKDAPEVISEEPEVQQEPEVQEEPKVEEEPKNEEPEAGNEPPVEEENAGEIEGQEEPKVEEPQPTETEGEQAVEVEEALEEKVEELEQEKLPVVEKVEDVKVIEDSAKSIVKEVSNEVELLKKIQVLEAQNAEKELELQKMTLSKEVEKDYAGVPGKIEDKVDFIYEIKNSSLTDNAKKFVLDALQSLSSQNLKDCQEIGHEQEVEIDEKEDRAKQIKDAMEKYDLTESQAFLYVNGDRQLAEAKKASDKVRAKRK